MIDRRTLSLRREQLGELSDGELTALVGAATTGALCGPTLSFFCGSAYDGCITARTCTQ